MTKFNDIWPQTPTKDDDGEEQAQVQVTKCRSIYDKVENISETLLNGSNVWYSKIISSQKFPNKSFLNPGIGVHCTTKFDQKYRQSGSKAEKAQ